MIYLLSIISLFYLLLSRSGVKSNALLGRITKPSDAHVIALSVYEQDKGEDLLLLITNNLQISVDEAVTFNAYKSTVPNYKIKLSSFRPIEPETELYKSLCFPDEKCQSTNHSVTFNGKDKIMVHRRIDDWNMEIDVFEYSIEDSEISIDFREVFGSKVSPGILLSWSESDGKIALFELKDKGLILVDGTENIPELSDHLMTSIEPEAHLPLAWATYIKSDKMILIYNESSMHFTAYKAGLLSVQSLTIGDRKFPLLSSATKFLSDIDPQNILTIVDDKLDLTGMEFMTISESQKRECTPRSDCIPDVFWYPPENPSENSQKEPLSEQNDLNFIFTIFFIIVLILSIICVCKLIFCGGGNKVSSTGNPIQQPESPKVELKKDPNFSSKSRIPSKVVNGRAPRSVMEMKTPISELKSVSKTVSYRHYDTVSKNNSTSSNTSLEGSKSEVSDSGGSRSQSKHSLSKQNIFKLRYKFKKKKSETSSSDS